MAEEEGKRKSKPLTFAGMYNSTIDSNITSIAVANSIPY